ncbi:hypothetical protein SDRG_01389 [Saprolegnia diclina VS20]|uniref:CBS domain-containing protein n=1 Tax=Saprolegnia diclina (strain VS20) TaxID=1156394 RepID=T0R4X6_SAPDV|nr:hypothetical protein SDRG_01389 [Saprolegnia diclina VS20]EQC41420.1 hypothetical protein SDRG_01389 [Saprolegnia diclina VS20]|eukprot:XP_008605134.1 hypothetical protein SDRG_01389 [Saprolegnia diclina VS20]
MRAEAERRLSLHEFTERVLAASGDSTSAQSPRTRFESVVTVANDDDVDAALTPARSDRWRVAAFLLLLGFVGGALHVLCAWLIDALLRVRATAMDQVSPIAAYSLWTLYTLVFLVVAVVLTRLSPSAAGSGIAQMKTVLTGIDPTLYLPGYFSLRTLCAKLGGLIAANGAGLQIGTEGAFVHIMAIVATALLQLRPFASLQDRLSVRLQLLAASAAVAVSSAFGSPIGGVLFSIEVTATYYLISNYLKAFVSSVAAAAMVLWMNRALARVEGLALSATRPSQAPPSLLDLPLAILLGAAMGVLSTILQCATQWLALRRRQWGASPLRHVRFFVQWLDPLLVGLVTASSTYVVTRNHALLSLSQLLSPGDLGSLPGVAATGAIPLFLLPLSITLKFPTGVWLPTFVGGAACGRLFGIAAASLFPSHMTLGRHGFALVGAAGLTGASTRTVSAAVITLELTGNFDALLPVLAGVLAAIGVSSLGGWPSIYDILVEANALPYLPLMEFQRHQTVADILHERVVYVSSRSSVLQLLLALNRLPSHEIPVVDIDQKLLGVVGKGDLQLLVRRFYDARGLSGCERDWGDSGSDEDATDTARHSVPKGGVWSNPLLRSGRTAPTLDHIYTTLHRRPSSSATSLLRGDGLYPVHPAMLMNDDKMTALLSHEWSIDKLDALATEVDVTTECVIRPLAMTLVAETTLEDVHMLFTMLRMDHCYVTALGKLQGVVTTRALIKAATK